MGGNGREWETLITIWVFVGSMAQRQNLHKTENGHEVRIDATGELRAKLDEQANLYRGGKHKLAHEVLTRMETRLVIRSDKEAQAIEGVIHWVTETQRLTGAETKALKRINTALALAPGDLLLADLDEKGL